MFRIPRFLADPVPGTGTSLWVLLIVCPVVVAIVLAAFFAIVGNYRRHDDSQ